MSMTTVNIVTKSKQENDDGGEDAPLEPFMPAEVLDAINNLIDVASKHNIAKRDIDKVLTERRREYMYQAEIAELPKESEKVRVFRKGLEKFYENLEIHPKDLIQFLWDYEFEYSNYHIEVPVAAYKLYLDSIEMSQENIYACAKIRMRVNDAYYAISRKKNATSWRVGKASNIKRFHTYLDRLCDLRIKRFFLEKEWVRFLSSKEKYEYIELPWLKLIYLVENFYC